MTVVTPVDIIITLYVPTNETLLLAKRCILSVLQRTQHPFRLLLVDDQSPLSEIRDFSRRVVRRFSHRSIVTIFNDKNLGFVRTANLAMEYGEAQGHDVVLLNNDTEVTEGWLQRMASIAYRDRKIATVTPLSNNATIASFPQMHAENIFPPGYSAEAVARLVRNASPGMTPEIPTGHGFCLFVKREALRKVGLFDADAFGKGYGEENDFCCRCLEYGYYHVLDDTTFVYHKGEASFQGLREVVTGQAFRTLIERHLYFKDVIAEFETQDPVRATRAALGRQLTLPPDAHRSAVVEHSSRILFVNFSGGPFNGLRRYTDELIQGLGSAADIFTLESDGRNLALKDGSGIEIFSSRLQERLTWNRVYTNLAYTRLSAFLIRQLGFRLIQINCFEGHTFDLLEIAESLDIPVIYAAHDFELICPTHFLVDPNGSACKMCAHGDEAINCLEVNPYLMSGQGTAHQLSRFRDYVVREVIPRLSLVICPSQHAKQRLLQLYPALKEKMTVIPHGIGGTRRSVATEYERSGELRVATVGAMHDLKGFGLLKSIVERLDHRKFSFHHFGPSNQIIAPVAYHGPYEAEQLPDLLREKRIDIVLMLSLLPETFSYTLSEVALAGIPVIAHETGALPERIRQMMLGWIVPYKDANAVAMILNEVYSDRSSLWAARRRIKLSELDALSEMVSRYDAVYQNLTAGKAERPGVDARICEYFLRITSFTKQLGTDAQAERLNEQRKVLQQLRDGLHSSQSQCQRFENSLAIKLAAAIKRVPWLSYLLRKTVVPLLRRVV